MTRDEFSIIATRRIREFIRSYRMDADEKDIVVHDVAENITIAFLSHFMDRVFDEEINEIVSVRSPFIWIEYHRPSFNDTEIFRDPNENNITLRVKIPSPVFHCMCWDMVFMLDNGVFKNGGAATLDRMASKEHTELVNKLCQESIDGLIGISKNGLNNFARKEG